MTREEVIKILEDSHVMLKGHFLLTSGKHSDTYMQCAQLFQSPQYSEILSRELADRYRDDQIDLVVGPAIGGIILAYEVGRQLGVRNIFAERENGKMALRRGFEVHGMTAHGGGLYFVNENRILCRLEQGSDYDGYPIAAHWCTPCTDLEAKSVIKGLRSLYIRGRADEEDSALLIDVTTDAVTESHRVLLPRELYEVLEIPLKNEGRTFALKLKNEAGGGFLIEAGMELEFDERRRTV